MDDVSFIDAAYFSFLQRLPENSEKEIWSKKAAEDTAYRFKKELISHLGEMKKKNFRSYDISDINKCIYSFEEGKVFSDTDDLDTPPKNILFPKLKNKNTDIFSLISENMPVSSPDSMIRYMYDLSARLRYSDKIAAVSQDIADEINDIAAELGKNTVNVTVSADNGNKTDEIVQFLREKQTKDKFLHKPIKQMVYLSARPEPLLKTLPFITHFMRFIEEIVVCCPDKMAEFLAKNYKEKIKLTVITDSELLAGRELPADHTTRNFFLRCLAMQRDELDEEFIMSDDDYRPLEEITEEVFFSGGKYNAYYFIDLDDWKHTVTTLFSYDHSMFRTADFLKSNGYPTLQYSAHQPQVINRTWYREFINCHPESVTKGYDEWSTYFNYCSAKHRNYFRQLPYLTLDWPNVGTCWKYGVPNNHYLFENFYEENYKAGNIFEKYSPVFCSNISEQNKEKIQKALRIYEKSYEGFDIQENFSKEYLAEYKRRPVFSVHCPSGQKFAAELSIPERYALKENAINELRFFISRDDYSICSSRCMTMIVTVTDDSGQVLSLASVRIEPEQTETGCHIKPENIPEDVKDKVRLCVTCRVDTLTEETVRTVPLKLM